MELRKPEAGPRQPPGPSLDGYGGNAATGTEKTASVRTAKRAQAGRLRTRVRRAIIRLTKLRSYSQATNMAYGC